jgi:dTDP-4-amino-4,6-dideoxygalactose transaminase
MHRIRSVASQSIPFLDLQTVHRPLLSEILSAWESILRSAAFVGGPEVEGFEKEFAAYIGARHSVGLSSGTDALCLALKAVGIRPGDEIITVPHTFIATTEAITQAGATPVFVDVDPKTATLDPSQIEDAITPRTRALVPVHLYGQPADMDPILEIAARRGLRVVEDAAQAHGATYRGRAAGCMGDIACFSFYPGKNLGACGEAGAVTTDDGELAARVAMMRDHGQPRKYYHEVEGWNARMDALQAAALRIKLRHLDKWNAARQACATLYDSGLANCGVEIPERAPDRDHVYHLYVIRHAERDRLQDELQRSGVCTGIHYPIPLHLQKAYARFGFAKGRFPVAERWAERALSLPIFPEMRDDQVDYVCEAVRNAVGRRVDVFTESVAR